MTGGIFMTFDKFFGHDYDLNFIDSVKMFNIHHYIYISFVIATYVLVLKFAKKIKESSNEEKIKIALIIWLVVLEIIYHVHNWTAPRFSIPLHVCSVGVMLNIALLLTNNQKVFNYAFFYGILGGTMALLFPVSFGYTFRNIRYYHFLLIHLTIISIPLYYYKAHGFRVNYKTTLRVFRTSVIIMMLMIIINGFLHDLGIPEANYWFVSFIPSSVEGVFNSWSTYIVTFAASVFGVMNILYFTTHYNDIKNKRIA